MSAAHHIASIVAAYDDIVIRLYAHIRFQILRQRFLKEIGQYLPQTGRVLDIGCGFGLFSLFFALQYPQAQFLGVDINEKRIACARRAAGKFPLNNVEYKKSSAETLPDEGMFDAIYMLDIIHHIQPASVAPLITYAKQHLTPNGVLLIKDIATKPAFKRWFTWWLDKLMDFKTPVYYWPEDKLRQLLAEHGFSIYSHHMVDYLPYPHILYICRKS